MKHQIIIHLKRYFLCLLFFFLTIFIITFYNQNIGDREKLITNFPKIALKNQFGELKTIDDYKGKLILVDFWFSSCEPCLEEMKFYPELLKKHKELVILSISVDSQKWTQNLLNQKRKPWGFLEDKKLSWTFYNINNKNLQSYKVKEFPTYFIIDKNGTLLSSPKSGLYAVESQLGNIVTTKLSFEKYFNSFSKKDIFKIFRLYSILYILFILFNLSIKYLKRKKYKTSH
jgi:peroxiredoxin